MNNALKEAHEYYRDYIIFKDELPRVANTSLEMAKNHLSFYTKWHEIAVNLISEEKSKGIEIPESMKQMWDYKHKALTEEFDELKYKVNNAM